MLDELRPFLEDLGRGQFRRALTDNRVFRAWFRTGYPSTPRQQALIMFNNVFLHLHPVRIRRESLRITYTFCLGGLSFFLFLLLTMTGVLLMFYYRPATSVAYQDMKDLDTLVNFGLLLRNIHRYSAHGMVIVVFLHMLRVFYTGAYRPPREFNWAVGAILLSAPSSSASPATCCRGTSWASGPSPSAPIWPAPRRSSASKRASC